MIGVLLLNLGGPDSLEAVRPFLYNLFSDREIIRLGPSFMQKPLAWLIAALRHNKTESLYRLIGGKSPILDITRAQAEALQQRLNSGRQVASREEYRVFVGMRYWHPLIGEVVPEICAAGITKVVAVGLYPHYSVATTGSSLSNLKTAITGMPVEVFPVKSWYDHPLYIEALVEKIKKGLASFDSGEEVRVLFSAHSLPKKFIEDGDPYVEHIQETIRAVSQKIDVRHDLSYQSKSGPVAWLEPSTEEKIKALAGEGVRNLLVVPISFVSDHIETLYEIDILYKHMAEEHGIQLRRIESLNMAPLFIEALADITLKATREAGWTA